MIGYLKRISLFFSIFLILSCFVDCNINVNAMIPKVKVQKDIKMQELDSLGIKMNKYIYDCSSEEIEKRFKQMSLDRWKIYFKNAEDYYKKDGFGIYRDEYKTPESWQHWQSRYPYPMAFEYNLAYEDYDANIITFENNNFLAIEAPSSKNIKNFYNLINNYDIDCFVKLNAPDEYGEDYYPYWENDFNTDRGKIKIGRQSLNFFSYDWPHRKGLDEKNLLDLVKRVQNTYNGKDIMAVSCRAGAGRTGTFIAAYMIIDEIDKQIKRGVLPNNIDVNIDRVVWGVSIQRPFAITHNLQYETLYRLIDFYLYGE